MLLISGTFVCEKCKKGFMTKDRLRRHIASVHERRYSPVVRENRFVCKEKDCDKKYATAQALSDHVNSCHLGR